MQFEAENPLLYEFAEFRLDAEKRLLWQDGHQIALTPKVFDTLLVLLEHSGEVLEKERLMQLLWADSFVEESNLTQNVAVLRKALGEDSKQHKFILTIPGRGYRFVAPVRKIPADAAEVGRAIRPFPSVHYDDRSIPGGESGSGSPHKRSNWPVTTAVIILLCIAGAAAWWIIANRNAAGPAPVVNRTTQITTWTGLDFYPKISPDGNSIAFSSDRSGSFEIYVKPLITGAKEIQITNDGRQNFEPTISPDGSMIAYYAKTPGGIWLVPAAGGTPRQMSEFGTHPAWSPDGSQIAFQSDPLTDLGPGVRNAMPPSALWIISVSGGQARQLTQPGNPVGGHGAPCWSPDGKRIVFDVSDWNTSDLWSISVEDGQLKKLTSIPAWDPIYAPDGKAIYFLELGTVSRINVSDAGEPIGDPIRIIDGTGTLIRQISIDSKGKRLVYSALLTNSNIWKTELTSSGDATGDPIALTQNNYRRTVNPAFSPDGKKIAFQSFAVGDEAYIWTMDADGKNQTQLTTGRALSPRWFPDGRRIGFVSSKSGLFSFWSVAVEGGLEKKLFDFDEDTSIVRLSPDGTQVAYNSKKSGTVNIALMPVQGGESKQLTFDKELAGFPAWSPDGRWIAFEIKRGGDTHVGLVSSSGGESRQLTDKPGQSWVYDWSPDGDKIIFAGERGGLWNVCSVSRSTGEERQLTHFSKLNSYVRYPTWSQMNDSIAYEYAETTGNIWMSELK